MIFSFQSQDTILFTHTPIIFKVFMKRLWLLTLIYLAILGKKASGPHAAKTVCVTSLARVGHSKDGHSEYAKNTYNIRKEYVQRTTYANNMYNIREEYVQHTRRIRTTYAKIMRNMWRICVTYAKNMRNIREEYV